MMNINLNAIPGYNSNVNNEVLNQFANELQNEGQLMNLKNFVTES